MRGRKGNKRYVVEGFMIMEVKVKHDAKNAIQKAVKKLFFLFSSLRHSRF